MPRRKRSPKKTENKVFQGMKSRYLFISLKMIGTLAVLTLLVALGWWLFEGDYFRISRISCEQDGFPCSGEIQGLFGEALGKNIFLLKQKQLGITVSRQQPILESITVTKRLPDLLEVKIRSRQPFARLETPQGETVVVDRKGMVLPDSPEEFSGPKLQVASLPVIGETVADPQVLQGLDLIGLLQSSYIPFEYIWYPNEITLTTQLGNAVTATFSAQKDLSPQVDSLQYILHHSRMEDKAIRGIDLRFQKPIITFTQSGKDRAAEL